MNNRTITIRHAQPHDAHTIAQAVAMAIGDTGALCNYCGADYLAVLTEIAHSEATQYSWQNALIAECDGQVAGAIVGYDGAQLQELRQGTLAIIRQRTGRVPTIVDETEAGEYYLDSLATLPHYRSIGVGAALVEAFCKRAFAEGAERVGLIVDTHNPNAERLYLASGFEPVGERTFFGHQMRHLQKQR